MTYIDPIKLFHFWIQKLIMKQRILMEDGLPHGMITQDASDFWLHNCASKNDGESSERIPKSNSNWETAPAARIKKRREQNKSPYSGTEIWDREELFTIMKYEPEIWNKAILALLWDLDARNQEITSLKITSLKINVT